MMLFLQLLINGMAYGMIYGIIALGLVIIIRATQVLNLAQGEMVMIGAFVSLILHVNLGLPFYVAFVIAVSVVAILALLVQKVSIQFVKSRTITNMTMATFAISIILKDASRIVFGSDIWPFPFVFGETPLTFNQLRITPQNLIIIIVSIVLVVFLHLVLRKTRMGLSIRAIMSDQETSSLMGIHPFSVMMFVFVIAGILGAVAGILIMPIFFVSFNMGAIIWKGLVAAVVGGIYSFPGAILGGILLGMGEAMIVAYVSPSLKEIIIYVILIGFLLLKPYGILGKS